MVHILLLLSQEMSRHAVETVRRELVIPLDGSEQVKLHSALNANVLVVMSAIGFGGELCLPHACVAAAGRQNRDCLL